MSKREVTEGCTYCEGAFCFHEKRVVPIDDYLSQEIMEGSTYIKTYGTSWKHKNIS